nr:alpha/beta hydrolase [Boseongicola sp. H5]
MFAQWGLDRPSLLCHDFGGATALRAYCLNGLRYRDLTVFAAVALAPWGSPFVAHVRNHQAAFAGPPAYAHDAILAAYLLSAAHKPLRAEALELYRSPWRSAAGHAAFYRQIAQMDQAFTDEIEPHYGPLDCPTQALWGAQDDWLPFEQGKRLADLLTGGRRQIVPEAGYLIQDDAPEAIVAAMLNPRW